MLIIAICNAFDIIKCLSDVPGKIAAPNATDIGKTWVSLSWGRPEQTGGAPVTAYKVESWILGEEARWTDVSATYCSLQVSPSYTEFCAVSV